MGSAPAVRVDLLLGEEVAKRAWDPLDYVYIAYRWGKGELKDHKGPKRWQEEWLDALGREIRARNFDGNAPVDPVQAATASGHGVGKSALVGMVSNFVLSTRPKSQGVITANTSAQLKSKTMVQVAKWNRLAITGHWFECGGSWVRSKVLGEQWQLTAQTCRKENAEAFQGLHAADSSAFYIFDEGSGIERVIWEAAHGGLTDGEPFWFVFGNPTRNSGAFYDCFHRERHRWLTRQIDSRHCELPNKRLIEKWIQDHGEDSDFVRIRVKGEFPHQSSDQLIPTDTVDRARVAQVASGGSDVIVPGLDVARSGSAESVLVFRVGRDARSLPWLICHERDSMRLARLVTGRVAELQRAGLHVAPICVDAGGVGGPVYDRIRELGFKAMPVDFGGDADDKTRYGNKAAEMWVRMRDWLADVGGAAIPDDPVLAEQLTTREREFDDHQRFWLESKDDLAERGEESPDRADALALTFAHRFGPGHAAQKRLGAARHNTDYRPPWQRNR